MADTGPPWNLRFPGPQDFVRETNFYIEDLAEDTAAALSLAGNEGIGPNVVQTVKTDTFSGTNTSYADVDGLTVTITPSSETSRVLVLAQLSCGQGSGAGNAALWGHWRLAGGNIGDNYVGDAEGSRTRSVFGGGNTLVTDIHSYVMMYLDSPATTSPVTYSVQAFIRSGTYYLNREAADSDDADRNRGASTLTVIEVAP